MPIFGFGGPLSAVPGPRSDRCGCSHGIFGLPCRPAAAAGVMPWARGLAFLSRRPIWCLAHKKNSAYRAGARCAAKIHCAQNHVFQFAGCETQTEVYSDSTPRQSESSSAVLSALYMNLCREFVFYSCQAYMQQPLRCCHGPET